MNYKSKKDLEIASINLKEDFEEDNFMKMEKARYGVGMTEKEIEEELEFDEEVTQKLKESN